MATNYIGSLRYDPHGRKRKSKAFRKPKAMVSKSTEAYVPNHQPPRLIKDYPSASLQPPQKTASDDQSWRAEASKNFTVAPAYNKGAYQVITRENVKHIGK